MRVALSGAGGFLGSRLAERLLVEGGAARVPARPRVVDHSRARRDLGYDPAIGVREGVERTARWYEQAGWL
jgi:nucleoside-diphosphate-sugar epimerase